jgi:hypothetical protein
MDSAYDELGTRILNAARLAVAMHLNGAVRPDATRRQVVIGGAGPHFVTDDVPTNDPVSRAARDPQSRAA